MENLIEINPGEYKVTYMDAPKGSITLKELGLNSDQLSLSGGLLRLVIDLSPLQSALPFYQVPTLEIAYLENVAETHWQCDFNRNTILDKMDHHGRSTVILLNRKRLSELEQRHENVLVLHAEFPEPVHINAEASYLHLF